MTTLDVETARELGRTAARQAASWTCDGNTPTEHARRVLAMLEDGDPAAEQYLPSRPNLSGEWSDSPSPTSLYEDITGESHADAVERAGLAYETLVGSVIDALADAWEEGVSDVFEDACAAELSKYA